MGFATIPSRLVPAAVIGGMESHGGQSHWQTEPVLKIQLETKLTHPVGQHCQDTVSLDHIVAHHMDTKVVKPIHTIVH